MTGSERSTLSRRDFVSLGAVGALGALGFSAARAAGAAAGDRLMYVGTDTRDDQGKGLYLVRMSRDSGALSVVGLAGTTSNPTFLTPSANGGFMYAVNEVAARDGQPSGGVTALARDRTTNVLHETSSRLTGGADPCYVTTDRRGRSLLVANYGGGSIAAFPILSTGDVGARTSFVQHHGSGPDVTRQAAPHAHCVLPDPTNRFVLVADLGIDRVLVYGFDGKTSTLTPKPAADGRLLPGAGPRHLAFHPSGRTVYVTNELNASITVFRYDPETGSLRERQTLPAINEPTAVKNAPADIHLHPSGRFLYMSNRGPNSISVFAIEQKSTELRPVQVVSTGGAWPRNFAIDSSGEFMLVANQRSDDIHSFRIDRRTGHLTATGQSVSLPAPMCIRFVS